MKKLIIITALLIVCIGTQLNAKPGFEISFGFFYSSLRSYGEWINLEADLTVWRPHGVSRNWRPYSNGRWSWTVNGWYWDSYEPFGWATYHYGRWYYDDYYGWIWIPDYEWAPSWVEWRYDDDYIGWAPLPPYARFEINFGIHFSFGWHSHQRYWNFVPYHRFCHNRVYNYFINDRYVSRIFSRTKYRTNYFYDNDRIINGGIDRSYIERRGGYRIAEREISNVDNFRDYDRNRNERGDRIYSYRPSEKEIGSARNERFDIRRGENNSSLDRDRIAIRSSRDSERNKNQYEEKSIQRNRDNNLDRGQNKQNEERTNSYRKEIERIQSERNQNRERARIESREETRTNREYQRERQPLFERPNRSERPQVEERRVEQRREQSSERATPRNENKSRGEERNSGRERSSERRR